jgi:hypothetical protein
MRERFRQNLDRHVAPKLGVVGTIHLAHSARTDPCENFIGPETRPNGQLLGLDCGLGQKARLSLFVRGDEGFHLLAQSRLGASLVKIGLPLAGRPFECGGERYANLKNSNTAWCRELVGPPGFEPGTDGL